MCPVRDRRDDLRGEIVISSPSSSLIISLKVTYAPRTATAAPHGKEVFRINTGIHGLMNAFSGDQLDL